MRKSKKSLQRNKKEVFGFWGAEEATTCADYESTVLKRNRDIILRETDLNYSADKIRLIMICVPHYLIFNVFRMPWKRIVISKKCADLKVIKILKPLFSSKFLCFAIYL